MTGQGKVIRKYPMVPGIDFAGTVVESASPAFKPGDKVVLTGWGVGESHWGGYAQLARVKAEWLVPLPEGLTLKQAMGIGTAGFTAMLCVMALEEKGLAPTDQREVVVTGAAGGVGSVAVAILAKLGYNVVASTGRCRRPMLICASLEPSRFWTARYWPSPANRWSWSAGPGPWIRSAVIPWRHCCRRWPRIPVSPPVATPPALR